jgi:hypothetical protein
MKYIFLTLSLFLTSTVYGQLVSDILRYSYTEDMATARSLAIGNAIAPLGGDFYTMSNNPAGLATYRYSEFVLSTGLRNYGVEAGLEGNGTFSDDESDVVLTNIGMVIVHNAPQSDWRTVNFGIGYNRNTSFDRRSFFQGSTPGSISDRWLERAQGVDLDNLLDYESGLAYDASVIYDIADREYTSDYFEDGGSDPLFKEETSFAEGGTGDFTIGFGANYKDRLYIGATFGIALLDYTSTRTYTEDDRADDNVELFEVLTYRERLETSGGGINAKLGLTYLFSQAFRWSFHFETGSRITVTDEFSNSLDYTYLDPNSGVPVSDFMAFPGDEGTLNFEYTMITPYQLSTGLGFLIGNQGFISATIDFHDYSSAKFEFDPDLSSSEDLAYERELNQAIDTSFGSAFTFRVGGEAAMGPLRLRAGGVMKQRPFEGDNGFDMGFSTGLGLRINRIFLDFAYRRFVQESTYMPYTITNTREFEVQNVNNKDIFNDFVLTFGLKF